MYSFLVLGIVPGTDVQINFQGWLVMTAGVVLAAVLLRSLLRLRRLATAPLATHQPLHASQLHRRRHPMAG